MIEVTLTEIVLFSWAALATGFALKAQHDAAVSKFFLHKLVTDETVRNEIVAGYEKFKSRREA